MSATEASLQETDKGEKGEKGTALESVRRLEERLEDRRAVEEAAEARVAAAREEARRIVQEAREEAERAAAEHRRAALARAEEEAERVLGEARAEAGTLRALAEGDREAAAREVVGLILPGRGG
jgi:vacuolar-type H+-ATPase subunit H